MRVGVPCRLLAAAAGAALLLSFASSAEAAHRRHRHHRQVEPPVAIEPVAPPPQDRAAYQSGFAFGLFDLGISGTSSALSPYAGYGYGTVRPGYDGPGFGYPGY